MVNDGQIYYIYILSTYILAFGCLHDFVTLPLLCQFVAGGFCGSGRGPNHYIPNYDISSIEIRKYPYNLALVISFFSTSDSFFWESSLTDKDSCSCEQVSNQEYVFREQEVLSASIMLEILDATVIWRGPAYSLL